MPAHVLLDAATQAPAAPGVYMFVGDDHDLLYVGKATDLRRRLRGHARGRLGVDLRSDARIDRVTAVGWEECGSEREALLREADLIVALRPPYNASHAHGPAATFVTLADDPAASAVRFRLGSSPPPDARAVYGSFPHLAKGGFSSPAKWTKRGYAALLRLMWAAQGSHRTAHIPRVLAGRSPPVDAAVPVDARLRPGLHRFLSGRGDRLVDELREAVTTGELPAYMRPRLLVDLDEARELYEIGPRRLQALRRDHRLPPGPVGAETVTALLLGDVRELLGDARLRVVRRSRMSLDRTCFLDG